MAETRVGIIANTGKAGAGELLTRVVAECHKQGVSTVIESDSAALTGAEGGGSIAEVAAEVSMLVVLGGDGTMLHAVHQLRDKLKPVAGINLGTLGFLTCATAHDLEKLVTAIAEDTVVRSRRRILEVDPGDGDDPVFGLNEAVVSRCEAAGIISLEAHIDESFFSSYSGDGLIVATPTGSTAYSFSAGGAIVDPASEVFLLTPICPHALANRSMVVPNESDIWLGLRNGDEEAVLMVDGHKVKHIGADTKVRIRRAPFDLELIMLPGQTFHEVLRRKLRWSGSNV